MEELAIWPVTTIRLLRSLLPGQSFPVRADQGSRWLPGSAALLSDPRGKESEEGKEKEKEKESPAEAGKAAERVAPKATQRNPIIRPMTPMSGTSQGRTKPAVFFPISNGLRLLMITRPMTGLETRISTGW